MDAASLGETKPESLETSPRTGLAALGNGRASAARNGHAPFAGNGRGNGLARALAAPRLPLVRVLDLDPELGAAVDPAERKLAAVAAVAPLLSHRVGVWNYCPEPDPSSFGALILEGLVGLRTEVDGRGHVELLGEGDLISPWVATGPDLAFPTITTVRVLNDLRMALLDRRFALRTARWPEIHAALMHRLTVRSRRAGLQAAINAMPRIEDRLELTFWHLADRFGRVTPEGCKLRLRFTHAQLAEMVAAQRPSVSVALARLAGQQRVVRLSKDDWLLCASPPEKLLPLVRQVGLKA